MEKYLHKCLDSLIIDDEGMKQLEVLVINDGSKDSSSQIAHEYQDKYPDTFRVIDKENGNYGSCINRGLKEATGKYVKVLDADDSFDTVNFEKYLELLSMNDVDLVITSFYIVDANDEITRLIKRKTAPNIVGQIDKLYEELISDSFSMHEVTYKKKNLTDLHYTQTEGISYTDAEWMFLPMTNIRTFVYYNIPVYRYLVGREGQTIDPKVLVRTISQHIQVLKSHLLRYNNLPHPLNVDNYLHNRIYQVASVVYRHFLLNYGMENKDLYELEIIDTMINEIESVKYLLDCEKINPLIPFRYIKYWHKIGSPTDRPYIFRLLSWLSRIRH